jgi:hypothetical protein
MVTRITKDLKEGGDSPLQELISVFTERIQQQDLTKIEIARLIKILKPATDNTGRND